MTKLQLYRIESPSMDRSQIRPNTARQIDRTVRPELLEGYPDSMLAMQKRLVRETVDGLTNCRKQDEIGDRRCSITT
ncbi:MAG: hypothetical protein MZU97_04320 [Bacillus subtilis]|nr:hypothetical protein [Bacillus subtilis]